VFAFFVFILVLGILHGGLSFLFREILNAENLMHGMAAVNAYVFGLLIIVVIVAIIIAIIVTIILLATFAISYTSGISAEGLLVITGSIVGIFVFVTSVVVYSVFIFPNAIPAFRTNIFLYYFAPVLLIATGTIGSGIASFSDFEGARGRFFLAFGFLCILALVAYYAVPNFVS